VRQGIAIVRALVRKPALILFDEANTAFDMDTDRRLKALLAELQADAGLVLVSHRPSLVALADRRLTIMHGRLCEAPLVSRQPAAAAPEPVAAPAPALARAGR
jgi:ABC-type bacteriocin/lantibiotic exporter with double-glycine peptidase domain